MKTLEELLAEFNSLGEGQIVDVDVTDVVFFKAKIFWDEGREASVEIVYRCTNSIVVEIFGTADVAAVEAYFRKYHTEKIDAFQKRIHEFDHAAQEWGIHHHNNHIAFYENHVW